MTSNDLIKEYMEMHEIPLPSGLVNIGMITNAQHSPIMDTGETAISFKQLMNSRHRGGCVIASRRSGKSSFIVDKAIDIFCNEKHHAIVIVGYSHAALKHLKDLFEERIPEPHMSANPKEGYLFWNVDRNNKIYLKHSNYSERFREEIEDVTIFIDEPWSVRHNSFVELILSMLGNRPFYLWSIGTPLYQAVPNNMGHHLYMRNIIPRYIIANGPYTT
jgi:hypothetical protein